MAKDYDDELDLEETGGFGKKAVAEAAKRPTYRSTEGQVDERDRREMAMADRTKAAPKKQSFKSAFASARKGGAKTFMWNGKKYTTELASSKPSAPKASAPNDYMSKKADDDRAYRAPKMGEEGFMAKRLSPSEAANARTSADYKGKSAKELGMGSRMDPMQAATAGMDETEKVGTYKKGGKVKKDKKMDEMKMMGREGRGMAKADMQKKMKSGGITSSLKAHASAPASKAHAKYAKGGKVDGCARKGKTKGKMV